MSTQRQQYGRDYRWFQALVVLTGIFIFVLYLYFEYSSSAVLGATVGLVLILGCIYVNQHRHVFIASRTLQVVTLNFRCCIVWSEITELLVNTSQAPCPTLLIRTSDRIYLLGQKGYFRHEDDLLNVITLYTGLRWQDSSVYFCNSQNLNLKTGSNRA